MTLDLLKRSENGAPLSATQHDANLTAIENAFNGISVADRAAMAALNTATGGYAFLKESGREGWFKWDSSNLSAQVTADPQQGVYVAPASAPTGASGAWVRQFEGPLHLDWWAPARDGVTDDSGKLQAAVNLASASEPPSRKIVLGFGASAIATTVLVSVSNIEIVGLGADIRHADTSFGALSPSRLIWTGTAGGTIIKFESPSGASNKKQSGGGIRGVMLDGGGDTAPANAAGTGLAVVSWNYGTFEWLGFKEFATASILIDCVASLTDTRDTQQNIFRSIRTWNSVQSGDGVRLQRPSPGANPSFNTFENVFCQHKNGNGWSLFGCDNNVFRHCGAAYTTAGSGNGVVCYGSNSDADDVPTDNIFDHLTCASGVVVKGTASYTHPSGANSFLNLDFTNGTPVPTVEVGVPIGGHITFATGAESQTQLAAAATTNLSVSTTKKIVLTGTASISSFGSADRKLYFVRVSGAGVEIVHGANLICPGSANIICGDGDTFIADCNTTGIWRVEAYQRQATPPPAGTNTGDQTITLSGDVSGSGTGAITADLLAGYDLLNACFNGDLKKGDLGFTKQTGWTISSDAANALSGNYVAKNTDVSGTQFVLTNNTYIACEPDVVIRASAWFKTDPSVSITDCKVQVVWYDKDKAVITGVSGPNFTTAQTSYTESAADFTAPANTAFARVRFMTAKTLGNVWCGKVTAFKKRDAAQILKANSVTLTELAQMATASFLGRNTAGTGNVEVLPKATAKTLLDLVGTNTGDQNLFSTIAVSGQSDVVADSATDTLTLVAGTGISITTNSSTDSVTITNTAASGLSRGTVEIYRSGAFF